MGARGVELSNRRQFRRDRTLPPGGCSVRCISGQTGKRSASSPNVRRRLGMDAQRLLALPRLPRCSRRAWRVQRQIHVQPIRPARWFLRDIPHSYPPHLSQFLSTGKTLAVHRNQTRTRSHSKSVGRALLGAPFQPHNDRRFNHSSAASFRARIGGFSGGCYCWSVVESAHDPVQILL